MDIQSIVGKLNSRLIWYDEVNSTNEVAKGLLKLNEYQEGVVIATHHQTAGRGQVGQSWQSEAGKNVLCTLMLKPEFLKISEQTWLNMAVCLSVIDLLETLNINALIKWPNDVYINRKKVAGLLIENQIQGNQIRSCLVGLGLNVNQKLFTDLPKAVSLLQCSNQTYNLNMIIEKWVACFSNWYVKLKLKQFDFINKQYHKHLMGLNENVCFEDENGFFEGQIEKVNNQGQLVVNTPNGLKLYHIKQIKWHENSMH